MKLHKSLADPIFPMGLARSFVQLQAKVLHLPLELDSTKGSCGIQPHQNRLTVRHHPFGQESRSYIRPRRSAQVVAELADLEDVGHVATAAFVSENDSKASLYRHRVRPMEAVPCADLARLVDDGRCWKPCRWTFMVFAEITFKCACRLGGKRMCFGFFQHTLQTNIGRVPKVRVHTSYINCANNLNKINTLSFLSHLSFLFGPKMT